MGRRDIACSNTQSQTLQSGGSQVLVKDLMRAKGPASKNTRMHSDVLSLGYSRVLLCSIHGI